MLLVGWLVCLFVVFSNSDGGCICSPLAGVQPHSLILLACLKRTGSLEMKEEGGRGPCSSLSNSRSAAGSLCINKGLGCCCCCLVGWLVFLVVGGEEIKTSPVPM